MKNEALELAKRIVNHAFKGKTDRGGKKYVDHLNRVADAVERRSPHSSTPVIAAMLHDLLEDCPEWTPGALYALFPEVVVDTVVELTRKEDEPYEDYIERINQSGSMAVDIKIADLEDNMDVKRLPELTDDDIKRLRKYHKAWKYLTSE